MKRTGLLIETRRGAIKPGLYGPMATAKEQGTELVALLIDENPQAFRDKLRACGVDTVVSIAIKDCRKGYHPYHWAGSIVAAMKRFEIATLLGLSTSRGRTLLPMIASELDAPLAMDCLSVDLNRNIAEKPLYSGKAIAKLQLRGTHFIYGMAPSSGGPVSLPASASCRSVPFEYRAEERSGYRYVGEISGAEGGPDLSEAEAIVSGGRGLGSGENFDVLRDCARALNASVGASRTAVDSGWVPYRMQVGQTGAKVSPRIYIACGISGSVQHFAGMKRSGLIVAINSDENAAISSNCDYFVNEDLFAIVPLLTQKLKNLRNSSRSGPDGDTG